MPTIEGVVVIRPGENIFRFVRFDPHGQPWLSSQAKPFGMLVSIFMGKYHGLDPSLFADYSYEFIKGELVPHPWVMMYKKCTWWDRWTGNVKRNVLAEAEAKRKHFTIPDKGIYGDVVLCSAERFLVWEEVDNGWSRYNHIRIR